MPCRHPSLIHDRRNVPGMERRVWRLVDADLFRFTTSDLRELHLALMMGFEQAAVLAPALGLDQVHAALAGVGWDDRLPDETVQRALASLVGWGLLEVTQDHAARYATPEEFERKNLQWSLTRRGEAAVAGVRRAADALRHAVGLQAAVLDAIGDGLSDLVALLAEPRGPEADARIHLTLAQVERHLEALVGSVRQFSGHLQRLLREDATDELFADVKRRTISYLEEYVEGVERRHRRLVDAIDRVESSGRATAFDRALVGANLAPVAEEDPGLAWLTERERHWRALQAWFAPEGADTPLVLGLLDVARTAIVELLRVLERRWDSRRRSASVAHDFRALADWFAAAPGDDDAHRLFGAAFGLWPSRHAHVVPPDGEWIRPNLSWSAAAPAEVAPALRTVGDLVHRGRANRVGDPSLLRAARQRTQAEALATHEALRAGLATGTVRLSAFGTLRPGAFSELLLLLGSALEAPIDADGRRRGLSVDGRVEVVVSDPHDGRTAVVATDLGELRGPDVFVSILVLDETDLDRTVGADVDVRGAALGSVGVDAGDDQLEVQLGA